jgi:hypothetical protein
MNGANTEKIESYEEACARTGRKWPYRTEDWPCPACGKAECDLDIDLVWKGRRQGVLTYCYSHKKEGAA